jgi:S-adenosyl-L-methionine hydrolase (adenosine-forming)
VSGPVITFLSDYGLEDEFVGVCHGVIAMICPDARVIDVGHGVPRHDIRAGALMLRGALAYMPAGVHLAIVDPDVGAKRRAVALRAADERLLVGPDNGLLLPAALQAGAIVEAVDISRSRFRLEPVSATFHGRDIFAPVAARLAAGTPLAEVGEPCDPAELVALALSRPLRDGDMLVAHVVRIDRFGNIQLDVSHQDLAGSGLRLGHGAELETGSGPRAVARARHSANYVRTFADVSPGELLVYEDSHRWLAVAVSHGSAAERLGVAVDDEVRVKPA